jgi:hypothetical protein
VALSSWFIYSTNFNPEGVARLTSKVIAYLRQNENLLQQTVQRLSFINIIDFAVSWGLTKKETRENVKFQPFPLNAGLVGGFQIRNTQISGLQIQKSGEIAHKKSKLF